MGEGVLSAFICGTCLGLFVGACLAGGVVLWLWERAEAAKARTPARRVVERHRDYGEQ